MRTFKTLDGVEWKLNVNVLTIRRVEADCGIRLTSMFENDGAITRMLGDEMRVVDVLVSALAPQLTERGVSADHFLEKCDQTTIEAAVEALVLETANFFREPRRSLILESLAKAQAAATRLRNEALDDGRQKLAEMGEDAILEAMRSSLTPTNSPSSSPASAE